MRRRSWLAATLFLALGAPHAYPDELVCGHSAEFAAAPKSFDNRTGRDTINYPRDPKVFYKHLKLKTRFDDFATKSMSGTAEYTLRPIAPSLKSISLDAVDFIDVSVLVNGKPADFSYNDRELVITFPTPPPTDADTTVTIHYRIVDPDAGLIFAPPDPLYPKRPVSLHTQGQTETNRFWFPSHDSPNVKFTTETIVTVPKPFVALSNGQLVEKVEDPDGKLHTFHYKQDVPHVAYLTSLAAGNFDIATDKQGDLLVEYWVPKEWSADTRRTFRNTPKMIALFEKLTGVKYPYAKYAQAVVPRFEAGGMENISATTLVETCLIDERAAQDGDADGLIAHELAHQWYGDLLTCRSWAHIWLNEGFASFMDDIWFENDKGRDWYECSFRNTYSRVADADKPDSPDALIYRDYQSDWEPFGHKGSLPYSKGSSILAMLRHILGDEIFWKGIQTYTKRFAARNVETDDFRHVLEEVSGRSLEQFFQQYAYRPGTPTIDVDYHWNPDDKAVEISFKQTQTIDAKTPAFVVPIDLSFGVNGRTENFTFDLADREATFRHTFEKEPTLFCVDPHAGLLARLNVDQPRSMWIRLLKDGPTAVSRMDAATALGKDARRSTIKPLAECLANPDEFWMVRNAAAVSLGKARFDEARDALINALSDGKGIENPRVRRAAVEALRNYRADDLVIAALTRFAKSDPSYAVEEAATRALGETDAKSAADVIAANLNRPTRYDRLTLAAIESLADLEDPRGLDPAMKLASPGAGFRVRPQAIRLLPRFARAGDDATRKNVREFLERLLYDSDPPALRASISALAELGDDQAIPALQARAQQGQGRGRLARDELQRNIDEAISSIRAKSKEPAAVKSLREQVEKMQKDSDDTRRRMRKLEPRETAKEDRRSHRHDDEGATTRPDDRDD